MSKNLLLKIIVLLVAAVLWLQLILLQEHVESFKVPITLINLSAKLVPNQETLPEIPITIKGKGIDLIYLQLSGVTFEVDASEFEYGDNKLLLDLQNLSKPKRIEIELHEVADGEDIYVNLDKVIERKKSIELQYKSVEDEEFFTNYKILIAGIKVALSGPSSLVNEVNSIKTEKLSKNSVINNKIRVKLIKPDARLQLQKEQLNLEIMQTRIITKTISLIPITFPHTLGISIIPQKVTVMISGPEDILQGVDKNSIKAQLDINNIHKAEYTGILFELPTGTKIQEYTPSRIQVIKND